ncbi:porin OmpC [Salmonella enterica]|nr:porin OmpC [Salmonella enterica]
MKKIMIAAALISVSASGVASEIYNKNGNKVDLYGKVKAQHRFTESSNQDETYARLGFRGETQINDKLTGFGQFEHQFNAGQAEGSQSEATRLAYAGVRLGDVGSVDYGRNYGIVYDVGSYADSLTEFGGDSYQRADNFMTGRTTGVLTLRNTTLLDGLEIGLQFQGENKNRAWNKTNGQGAGASLEYELIDSLTVGGAYSHASQASKIKSEGYANGDAEAWTVGARYMPGSLYLATTYAETRNMTPFFDKRAGEGEGFFLDKTRNFEAIAAWVFDSGIRPSIGYLQSRADVNGQGTMDVVKYIQVGVSYNLNKNMVVDVGYKINLLKDTLNKYGVSTDNHAIAGMTYQF